MSLDRKRHRLALRRQRLQGARRAMHHIADAVHVDDDEVLAVAIDDAFELADHPGGLSRWSFRDAANGSAQSAARWRRPGMVKASVPLIWLPLSRARSRDGARA